MKATRLSITFAAVFAVSSVLGVSHSVAQEPLASLSATLFRDIARGQNPVVVSVMTRSRARRTTEDEKTIFRVLELDPPLDRHVQLGAGSGFLINGTGDILTNNHVVEGADRIDVSLFGNERKRYRAVLVGSDPQTDSALIRLQNPPPGLQAATLGDSGELEPGDWVVAIGNPFQLGHSVTVGVVSFPSRPVEIEAGRWPNLIQTDAAINHGNSGGPLFNVRGEVVGINVAMLDTESGANVGIGFAIPINTVRALLPQLRKGKVVRGQLGVRLHGGPLLEDEAKELGLPRATGAIVMSVDDGSAGERAGLRAGDVIVEIDGKPVADTRDLLARTSSTAPGTRVTVKIFRNRSEKTCTAIMEEQPVDVVEEASADDFDGDDGLTLGEVTAPGTKPLPLAAAIGGALVVRVAPYSPADDAELVKGDIIRTISGRAVHTLDEARRTLRGIPPGRPIFLAVSRRGKDVFLEMRKDTESSAISDRDSHERADR